MFPLTLINALDITKNECNQIVLVYTKLSQNALSFRNTVYYINFVLFQIDLKKWKSGDWS